MIIKRLAASFGALKGDELKLEPGLNIVEAPNEGGKSTWCGFIRAMLYGINTAERDKQAQLSEKTKYRPWSGGAMEGTMDLLADDTPITIERTALGSAPMKKLVVRHSETGQLAPELASDSLGEMLTGVPEKVFERGAFIRQAEIAVSNTGELESRIASLVSSGEEMVSFRDTDELLRSWMRQRKHNKTGQIPALEAELAQLDETLARLDAANIAFSEISLDLDQVTARVAELREDLRIHVELERREQRLKLAEIKKKIRELDWEISSLRKQLDRSGSPVSREVISAAQNSYEQLSALTVEYTEAKAAKEAAEKDLMLIEEDQVASPFEGGTIAEAEATVATATQENLNADKATDYNQQKFTIPMAVLAVGAVATLVAAIMLDLVILYPVSLVCAALAVALSVIYYRKHKAAKLAERKRQEMFMRLRVGSIEQLGKELEQYERLCAKAVELRDKFQEADRVCEDAMTAMQKHKDVFEAAVRAFAPDIQDLAQAFQAMSEVGRLVDRLEQAEREQAAASALFESMTAAYEGDWQEPVPKDTLTPPLRTKSETVYDLKRVEFEMDALKNSYAIALGEMKAIGDPVVLGAKRNQITDRLAELNVQHEALSMAVEVLKEADSEIRGRFSPLLERRAGEYLDQLTGGVYKRVLFDEQLKPSTERAGEVVSRDILYLSGGTADQVYLALRLAICDLIFPEDKACPVILDDALVSFDQERMVQAVKVLKEVAKGRQVILFSCHRREAEAAAGDSSVNVVSLA